MAETKILRMVLHLVVDKDATTNDLERLFNKALDDCVISRKQLEDYYILEVEKIAG